MTDEGSPPPSDEKKTPPVKAKSLGEKKSPALKVSSLANGDKRLMLLISFFGAITFLAGLILTAYAFLNYRYEAKPKDEGREVVFEIPRGSGLSSIATRLEKENLIKSASLFKLITKLRGNERNFKAGEFQITYPASMAQIYETLSEGQAILYPFTVPEGLTSTQILRKMSGQKTLVQDYVALPTEGSLLPETYMLPRGMKKSDLIKQMKKAQVDVLNELWDSRDENLPIKSKAEAVILASVVEKETGVSSERDVVAGVFINRLRKGMRLQSDPTIIYGVSKGEILLNKKGKQRGIRRSEIDKKTDWNTYQIDGLPKTPICNPGKDAIAAVLKPAQTEYLFFVADGTGGHVFAKTVRDHNNNVNKWRKIERKRRQK